MSKGRPEKYSDQDLLDAINKYILDNSKMKIGYVDLEKATEIPAHVWKRRMRKFVDEYNEKIQIQPPKISLDNMVFPSVDDVILKCQHNPNEARMALEMILEQAEQNLNSHSYETKIIELEESHKKEIHEYEVRIKEYQKEIENLEREMSLLFIHSQYGDKRKQQGIVCNILDFTKESEKRYDEILKNLEL